MVSNTIHSVMSLIGQEQQYSTFGNENHSQNNSDSDGNYDNVVDAVDIDVYLWTEWSCALMRF